jgi:hypothetical protein
MLMDTIPQGYGPHDVPDGLRSEVQQYLRATSDERASLFKTLYAADPALAEMLVELESDWTLRADFQVALGGQ